MAPVAQSSHDYWRPADPAMARLVESVPLAGACWRCGTDYSLGARFCHLCGSERDPRSFPRKLVQLPTSARPLDFAGIRQHLQLSAISLIFLVLGVGCMLAALLTGFIYKTDALLDWQAVQLWRIEWLLAASAALLAGILLKKSGE